MFGYRGGYGAGKLMGYASQGAAGGGEPTGPGYAVTGFDTPGTVFPDLFQSGWVFTVGANDLLVDRLRFYQSGTSEYRVDIHRNSNSELIARTQVEGVADDWAETVITPVTLLSGVQYTISARIWSGQRSAYQDPTGVTFTNAITVDNTGVTGANGVIPTTDVERDLTLTADFGFTIP